MIVAMGVPTFSHRPSMRMVVALGCAFGAISAYLSDDEPMLSTKIDFACVVIIYFINKLANCSKNCLFIQMKIILN